MMLVAGFGCRNNFFDTDFEEQQDMLQLHITVTARIIHEVVPKMGNHEDAYIINVASLSAF